VLHTGALGALPAGSRPWHAARSSRVAADLLRALRSVLFGVDPLDSMNLVLTVVAIGSLATLASYLPARRAARIDPVSLLRSE